MKDYKEEMRYKSAQKRVKDIKGFYVHLAIYIVINAAIFILAVKDDGFTNGISNLSNYSTIVFWGIGILFHWLGVFGSNFMFTKDWEERKIKKLMEEDKKQLWK